MPVYPVGKAHSELTQWLLADWLKTGPPVSFIEGFSGVGKSTAARAVMEGAGCSAVYVNMPEAGMDQVDNLFLDLATALSHSGIDDLAIAVTAGRPFDKALRAVLTHKVVLVIDEFQRALNETGKPVSPILHLLGQVASRPKAPGRILLLTDRIIDRGRWSKAYGIRTLGGLPPAEAEELLNRLLGYLGRSQKIPAGRRREVVNWLGGNPRAIHLLVAALEQNSLDELIGLIGIKPEPWAHRERTVSTEDLHYLERKLLERMLEWLPPQATMLLQRFAVYRKPVNQEAIEMLLPDGAGFAAVQERLISCCLLEQHAGRFSLNPVVREVALQQLKAKESELNQAHRRAADHYLHHFRAKGTVESGKLGGYFVEARHHLVQIHCDAELNKIVGRFEAHLNASYSSISPTPPQPDELNERIATLAALLARPGAPGLEYYLARLLEARHGEGDMAKALLHARKAARPAAPAVAWTLCLRLEAQVNGPEQALRVAQGALAGVPADRGLFAIYQEAGELLAQAGETDEAIALLKDGITKIPTDKSLFGLYRSAGALLAQTGKTDEAIALLKTGIARIPADRGLSALYQSAGALLAQTGKTDEAIALLKEGIARIPADRGLSALYQSAGELLAQTGKTDEAIVMLKAGLVRIPSDQSRFSFYQNAGEFLARAGRSDDAIALLKEGIARIPADKGLFILYHSAGEILAQAGRVDDAIALLKEGIAQIPADKGIFVLYQSAGELLAQTGRTEDAITLLKAGIARIPVYKGLFSLYKTAGELLAQVGKFEDALTLLTAGIDRIPVEQSLFSLYQSAGRLLAQMGKTDKAIAFLKSGIARIPADNSLSTLYESAGELLAQTGKFDEALALLREGIDRIPVDKGLSALYLCAGQLLTQAGQTDEAIILLKDGIAKIPNGRLGRYKLIQPVLTLLLARQDIEQLDTFLAGAGTLAIEPLELARGKVYQLMIRREWEAAALLAQQQQRMLPSNRPLLQTEAFCWLCANKLRAAEEVGRTIDVLNKPFEPIHWFRTWVALKQRDHSAARANLSVYMDRPVTEAEVSEQTLVALWDMVPGIGERVDLAYHFPILPTALTGLPEDRVRIPRGPWHYSVFAADLPGTRRPNADALEVV